MVTALLPHEHLTRHPLDAKVSQRMLDLFLKTLDPMKMYFYQSDVDAFMAHQNELVDQGPRGATSSRATTFSRSTCSGSTSG